MNDTARPMSRVDTAWLRMDTDVNLMMIVGVWLLQPAGVEGALQFAEDDEVQAVQPVEQPVEALGRPERAVDRRRRGGRGAHH